jgi:RNA recognition motif-containing protein
VSNYLILNLGKKCIATNNNNQCKRYKYKLKEIKNMAMKLYVGGLAYSTNDQELEQLFAQFGKVSSAVVIMDRDTGRSKGFGFVEMDDIKEAQNAMKELDGKEVSGRKITVNQARPQEDRRPRSGGGGGGGNGGGFRRQY